MLFLAIYKNKKSNRKSFLEEKKSRILTDQFQELCFHIMTNMTFLYHDEQWLKIQLTVPLFHPGKNVINYYYYYYYYEQKE